jgi:hypothetical protein
VHCTLQNAVFVADDLLSPADHASLWDFFVSQEFRRVHDDGLTRVYRLTDGESWISAGHYLRIHAEPSSDLPPCGKTSDNPLMRLFQAMFADERFLRLARNFTPWSHLSFNCSLYPAGCGLGWHADKGHAAAFIYYVHPQWGDSWGGELLLQTPARPGPTDANPHRPAPSQSDFYSAISMGRDTKSDGYYLAPTPNRLVVFPSGVRHMVKRVEPAAGEAFRAAISGFFTIPRDPPK